MPNCNKVILLGNVGKDPVYKELEGGKQVCSFTLATNEQWTGKDGEKKKNTEWHYVEIWGKAAETASKHLSSGHEVLVEGMLKTKSWEDSGGNKRQRTVVYTNGWKI